MAWTTTRPARRHVGTARGRVPAEAPGRLPQFAGDIGTAPGADRTPRPFRRKPRCPFRAPGGRRPLHHRPADHEQIPLSAPTGKLSARPASPSSSNPHRHGRPRTLRLHLRPCRFPAPRSWKSARPPPWRPRATAWPRAPARVQNLRLDGATRLPPHEAETAAPAATGARGRRTRPGRTRSRQHPAAEHVAAATARCVARRTGTGDRHKASTTIAPSLRGRLAPGAHLPPAAPARGPAGAARVAVTLPG